jgi:1-acyl-sn-glycerol-3-phosphate acyltransferase
VRDLTYPPIIVAAKLGFRALGLRFDIDGAQHVPTSGGAVLALNHISYVDFILGGYAAQPSRRLVRFMAKRELFDHRLTGPLMRSMHHIEVDRAAGQASYGTALSYLRSGEIVGVFPEATISRSFDLKEFKPGAVRLAAEASVPVIPAVLWGTQRIYTKDHPRDLGRGKTIMIRVGEPMQLSANHEAETARLRAAMASLLDAAIRSYPDQQAGAWWTPRSHGGTAPTPEEAAALDAAERERRLRTRRGTPPDVPPAATEA